MTTTFRSDGSARDNCPRCFWSAPITRGDPQIWCAHARHHGWKDAGGAASCNGDGFRIDERDATP